MKNVRELETEADYDQALADAETYFANLPAVDSEAAQRFNDLTLAIQAYEMRHWRVDGRDPTPIA
jgi:antitoxin component HigA of HigAB toxin-antitoxin module